MIVIVVVAGALCINVLLFSWVHHDTHLYIVYANIYKQQSNNTRFALLFFAPHPTMSMTHTHLCKYGFLLRFNQVSRLLVFDLFCFVYALRLLSHRSTRAFLFYSLFASFFFLHMCKYICITDRVLA